MNLLQTWKTSPEALLKRLAEHRVRRGIKWLDRHAPQGWWLRLFVINSGGTWSFLAKDCLGNRCVLALAFQTREDLASDGPGSYGYVTYATVMKNFKELGWDDLDKKLGFDSDKRISSDLLDATWEAVLPRQLARRTSEPLYHGRTMFERAAHHNPLGGEIYM